MLFPFLFFSFLLPCSFLSFPCARCEVRGTSCAFSFSFPLPCFFPSLPFPFLSFLFLRPLYAEDELEVALPIARNLAAAMCQGMAEPQPALQPQLCERLLHRVPIPQNVGEVKAQKQLRVASRELGMEVLDPLPVVRANLGHERRLRSSCALKLEPPT